MIIKFEIFESKKVWHIGPVGNISKKYTNHHDQFVTYDTPKYYEINFFLEWMYYMHILFDIYNFPSGKHNFKTDAKYPCAVKFSNFIVKNSCTWHQYTIGEGYTTREAIIDFINIVKGKTIVCDGGNHNYKTNEEIQVPDDFELWCAAKKYNL